MPSTLVTLPSGKQERCSNPGNCRRHGAAHAATNTFMQDVQAARQDIPKHLREGKQFPPIILQPAAYKEPVARVDDGVLTYDYERDVTDGAGDYYEGEAARTVIYATNVQKVDLPRALAAIFQTSESDLPKNLPAYAHAHGVGNPLNWEMVVENDYYGNEDYIAGATLAAKPLAALRAWYWQRPNAVDNAGVLAYCRSKGLDTHGFEPLAAIKAQLRQENPGVKHPFVTRATKVDIQHLKLARIHVPRMDRMDAITSRQPQVPAALRGTGTQKITGVVALRDGEYRLVDGYHRYKAAMVENVLGGGRFIILSA